MGFGMGLKIIVFIQKSGKWEYGHLNSNDDRLNLKGSTSEIDIEESDKEIMNGRIAFVLDFDRNKKSVIGFYSTELDPKLVVYEMNGTDPLYRNSTDFSDKYESLKHLKRGQKIVAIFDLSKGDTSKDNSVAILFKSRNSLKYCQTSAIKLNPEVSH